MAVRGESSGRRAALPAFAALLLALPTSACSPIGANEEWDKPWPDDALTGAWDRDAYSSPTGTTLVPAGKGGYEAIDEVCGGDLAAASYPERFATPMFRDLAVAGTRAWAVDGSHLWTFDMSDPAHPVRTGLARLEGHPVAVHPAGARLWVASIDAGLRGYAIDASGNVDPSDVVVAFGPAPGAPVPRVMDVAGTHRSLYAALGTGGLGIVALDATGAPAAIAIRPSGAFAAAVTVSGDRVAVASCWSVSVFRTPAPGSYAGADGWAQGHVPETEFDVMFGLARGVAVAPPHVFVAAGEALLVYRVPASPGAGAKYVGYFADDAPGFYVNGVVVDQGYAYLAAGDQSVRALDVRDLDLAPGIPVEAAPDEPTIDDPDLGRIVALWTVKKDPVAVALVGTHLFALGNFRWIGERTIEVFDVSLPGRLLPVGRYAQPDRAAGLSRLGSRWVVHGGDGRHRVLDAGLAPAGSFEFAPALDSTVPRGDDLYLLARSGTVARVSGEDLSVSPVVPPGHLVHGLAFSGDLGYATDSVAGGILVIDASTSSVLGLATLPGTFVEDATIHAASGRVYAYDGRLGRVFTLDAPSPGMPHPIGDTFVGACEVHDVAAFFAGTSGQRARFVQDGHDMYLFCPSTGTGATRLLRLDRDAAGIPALAMSSPLAHRPWTSVAVRGGTLLAASFDNGHYTSVVMEAVAATGEVLHEAETSGRVNAVAWLDGSEQVLVADGDRGVLVLEPGLSGPPAPVDWGE